MAYPKTYDPGKTRKNKHRVRHPLPSIKTEIAPNALCKKCNLRTRQDGSSRCAKCSKQK